MGCAGSGFPSSGDIGLRREVSGGRYAGMKARSATWLGLIMVLVVAVASLAADEPVNPFGAGRSAVRGVPAAVYVSDGVVYLGDVRLTMGRALLVFDPVEKRYAHIRLADLERLEFVVTAERIEREWRFKEGGSDVKVYTGKSYPRRDYRLKLYPKKEKPLVAELGQGMPLYILGYDEAEATLQALASDAEGVFRNGGRPKAGRKRRFILRSHDNGPVGSKLVDLVYIRRIEFGIEAVQRAAKLKLASRKARVAEDARSDGGPGEDAPGARDMERTNPRERDKTPVGKG